MNITELVGRAHDNAVKHGFWDPPLNFGTAIALIHSELSEALEEERAGRALVWYKCTAGNGDGTMCNPKRWFDCDMDGKEDRCPFHHKKPEGVAVELADAVIRIADLDDCLAVSFGMTRQAAQEAAHSAPEAQDDIFHELTRNGLSVAVCPLPVLNQVNITITDGKTVSMTRNVAPAGGIVAELLDMKDTLKEVTP